MYMKQHLHITKQLFMCIECDMKRLQRKQPPLGAQTLFCRGGGGGLMYGLNVRFEQQPLCVIPTGVACNL